MKKLYILPWVVCCVLFGSVSDTTFNILPSALQACDFCLMTRGFAPLEILPGPGFRVDARYTVLNSLYSGSNRLSNPSGEKETHFTTQLTLYYNVSGKFTVLGILPLPRRSVSLNDIEDHDGDHHHSDGEDPDHGGLIHSHSAEGSSFSVGDLNILARYTFLRWNTFKHSTTISIEGGVKIPTGQTRARDEHGEFLDAHIQPGTGSWNYLLGFSANHVNNYFGFSANILYSINTTGQAGDAAYRYGNWLNADVSFKRALFSSSMKTRNLCFVLGLNGEIRGKEELDGQVILNTGGEVFYLAPGLQFQLTPAITLEASLMYPFYHNLDGEEQLGEDVKSFFGLNYFL